MQRYGEGLTEDVVLLVGVVLREAERVALEVAVLDDVSVEEAVTVALGDAVLLAVLVAVPLFEAVVEGVSVSGTLHARKLSNPRAVTPFTITGTDTDSDWVPAVGTVYATGIHNDCPVPPSTRLLLPSQRVTC